MKIDLGRRAILALYFIPLLINDNTKITQWPG